MKTFTTSLLILLLASASAVTVAASPDFDLVFAGARVIDPESGLDAVRNVGVKGDRIVAVSAEALHGRKTIDAAGLIAAPGFIDLHSHAYGYETATFQAMDGVTTRLELEIGVFPVAQWYERKASHELLNYGASVSHTETRRFLQMGGTQVRPMGDAASEDKLAGEPIPDDAYPRFLPTLEQGLNEGAIGIGSGTQYAPGITHQEMLDLTRLASKHKACVFTHIRYGSLVEPGSTLEAIQENIANAAISGACIHIVHINSMAMSSTPRMIQLFHEAIAHGIDISTEIYPWDASVDNIRTVIFDPGWEARWGVKAGDLQSRVTGRRLTREEFDALRAGTADDGVLMHMNTEETITTALKDPLVIVASDSGDIESRYDHPRSAGTFARVLGHYVRETGALTLTEAIRKMSLMPAQRLEAFVPAMKRKGRLREGADADLVLFDPAAVAAGASYLDAKQYSRGMRYVLVNGQFVVRNGRLVGNAYPGRAVRTH